MTPSQAISLVDKIIPKLISRYEKASSPELDIASEHFHAALGLALLEAMKPPADWKKVRIHAAIASDGDEFFNSPEHASPCDDDTHRAIIEAWLPPVSVPVVEGAVMQ